MTQPAKKPSPATMPKRLPADSQRTPKRASGARKRVVKDLKQKREDNIRSVEPPRVLSQRIGHLFPELEALR